ncbi:hypothetical protein [Nibricoccus sp. IMCC34717]|uniref:hypothetical protein n=1 Tax=Nibricoccus sp. IMCC34717 TaxID=3034021 RepID=UPI00384FA8CF
MTLRTAFLATTALLLAGCSELPKPDPLIVGPFYEPTNVRKNVLQLPIDLRRVLLVPVATAGPSIPEDNLSAMDSAFQAELNRTQRFEVVALNRTQMAELIGRPQVTSTEVIPASFVDKILKADNRFGADAVLFVDLTDYKAYPPMSLGVRAKLVRISDMAILWAADLNFSADDRRVINSARKYARFLGSDAGPVDLSHTVLQSPTRFAAFAAHTVFGTLPER